MVQCPWFRAVLTRSDLLIVAWAILGPWFYYAWGLIASAGIYVHQWNVRYADLVDFLFNLNAGFIVYGPLIALVKAVILLDWLHIFVPRRTRNATAWTIYIMIALNWAYYVAGSLACIFSCSPRKRFWDKTVPGTCTSTYATALTAGVVNMVSDFTMLAIPQRVIWSLQLTRSQRVGVSSLFAIGILYVCFTIPYNRYAYSNSQCMRLCSCPFCLLHRILHGPRRCYLRCIACRIVDYWRSDVGFPTCWCTVFATGIQGTQVDAVRFCVAAILDDAFAQRILRGH